MYAVFVILLRIGGDFVHVTVIDWALLEHLHQYFTHKRFVHAEPLYHFCMLQELS